MFVYVLAELGSPFAQQFTLHNLLTGTYAAIVSSTPPLSSQSATLIALRFKPIYTLNSIKIMLCNNQRACDIKEYQSVKMDVR